MKEFKTNFAIGDTAYTVDPNSIRIVEFTVAKIDIEITADAVAVCLHPAKDNGKPCWESYNEETCYHYLNELIDRLNSTDIKNA